MSASKTQGTILKVHTALAATKTITGITAASPPVVTSATHGYANGDIVLIQNVVGMVQVNNRAFVVANTATNTFELKGVDGTSYTAYSSAGDSYKTTMASVGQCSGIPTLFTGTAPDIKVTHLLSTAEEKLQGLQDFGDFTTDLIIDNTDSGQAEMRKAKGAQTPRVFSITMTDTKIACVYGYVKSFQTTMPMNEAVRATCSVSIASEPAWFA
jgi:hypothetical protein